MSIPVYYKLFVRLIRKLEDGNINFITDEKIFKNSKPIIAREEAFDALYSYIDVLLEINNSKEITDIECREQLKPFYSKDGQSGYIGISMVVQKDHMNPNMPGETENNNKDVEYEIYSIPSPNHGILDQQMYNLVCEFKYYHSFGCETKNYLMHVDFFGCFYHEEYDAHLHDCTILKSPFDWSLYSKPRERIFEFEEEFHWEGFKYEQSTIDSIVNEPSSINLKEKHKFDSISDYKQHIKQLIDNGESFHVEFKPTMAYNFNSGTRSIGIKHIIAKGICAFLNAEGGYLIIGVNNDGKIQGLQYDYQLAPENKNRKDYFLLEFDNLIRHFFKPNIRPYVRTEIINIDNKDLFIITIWPRKTNPTFLNGQDNKEFYVRTEASSMPIKDVEDIVAYCFEHFKGYKDN